MEWLAPKGQQGPRARKAMPVRPDLKVLKVTREQPARLARRVHKVMPARLVPLALKVRKATQVRKGLPALQVHPDPQASRALRDRQSILCRLPCCDGTREIGRASCRERV